MEDISSNLLALGLVQLLAVMSPGPDFLLISRNSLLYSRACGVLSAIGIGLGVVFHLTYCSLGLGVLIAQSKLLFTIVKYLGAGYLVYLGVKALSSSKRPIDPMNLSEGVQKGGVQPREALMMGILTNVLNPKCALYFLSVYSQVLAPKMPLWFHLAFGVEMVGITIAWFVLLAVLLSHRRIATRFQAFQVWIEKVTGVAFLLLGLRLAL